MILNSEFFKISSGCKSKFVEITKLSFSLENFRFRCTTLSDTLQTIFAMVSWVFRKIEKMHFLGVKEYSKQLFRKGNF